MTYLLWNNPQPSAHFRGIVRVGLSNQGGDWPNSTPEFYVNGSKVTARAAARYLRESPVPVIDWIFNKGIPPTWSQADTAKLREIVVTVYKALGGVWGGLSKSRRAAISHILDAENYTQSIDKTKPRLDEATGMPHCATFAHLFGESLRAAGFTGPAANYAMAHGPECPAVGGGYNRATPFHCPGAMDGSTTFLSGYTEADPNDPGDYLTPEEIIDAIEELAWPTVGPGTMFGLVWLALSEYQPELDRVLDAATNHGVDLILIWCDEDKRKADPAWAAAQDKLLASYLGVN